MELFLGELLVRGTLLCLLAALALLLLRRAAAAYRHLICTLALCGLLTLPLLRELLPPLPLLVAVTSPPSKPPLPSPETLVPSGEGRGPGGGMQMPLSSPISPFPSEERGDLLRAGRGGGERLPTPRDLSFLCPLFWALGATILLLRLGVALVRLRTLARQCPRTTLLNTEVLVSAHVPTPLTWGVRRPVILLPAALLSGDPAVVESALRHEQAHIARRDWLWHLLAEVVCALCWFQPGAWWLRRQLRAESERACDDRVLLSGISGPDYAAHLLEILKVGRASTLAPGMAASGSMEARVKHILDPKKPRRSHGLRLAFTVALGLVLLPLASLKVAAKPGAPRAPKLTFLTPRALLAQAKATLVAPKPLAPMPLAEPTLTQPNVTLAIPQPPAPTKIPLASVVWGEAVDGLEPGLLLLSSEVAPQNSKVVYQTLLRNKSNKTISFFVRMLRDNGSDLPSFGVKQAEGTGELPPLDPLYEASLAPGEALLVPSVHEAQALLIGEDGSKDRPRVTKIVPGQYRLSQPITVYRSLEKSQLTRLLGSAVPEIKKISSDGTLRTVRSSRAGGTALPGAQTLEATRMLTVTPALPGAPGPTLPLDKVVWNEAVDGLTAGFHLTGVTLMEDRLGTTKIGYQTLVRNTSDKPISFYTRLLQYDGYETPTVDGKPTKGAKRTYPLDPLYAVTLAPGESVIVPAQNGRENLEIYVGEGGSSDSPSMATVTPGHLKITQPLTIYRSPDRAILTELMGIYTLSKVSPEGRVRTEAANRASGKIDGGQKLEAYIYLEIGTLKASAERNAASAVWGKVDRGLQCGIRMLNTTRTFKTGDTLEAELLWRNVSNKKAHWVNPRQLDIVPLIRKISNGSGCMVDMGARFMFLPSSSDYQPGEVRSLGIQRVTLVAEGTPSPKSNAEPGHITLAPGAYFFSGSGGVSGHGDPCPRSGEVAFTVVGGAPQPQKDEGIAWGKAAGSFRYGLRDKDGLKDIEILVQNVSAQTQTITHTVWPPHLAGRLVLRDSVGKAMPLSQLSAKQPPRTETKTLRPEEIALLHTKPFHHMVDTLKQGETYTLEWQGGSTDQATGRLAFQPPAPDPTAWGRGFNGVQLGLRLPKGVTTFSKLSEARFEVVLRNLGKPTSVSWITPANFSFYGPHLFTKDGEPIPYEHTVAGPYHGENRDLGSGETIVLGTIRIPREVQEEWDALPQGPYLASGPPPPSPYEARFSLGITVSGKGEQKLSARLPFTVTRLR